MASVAKRIAETQKTVILGSLRYPSSKSHANGWPTFADGWPNLFVEDLHNIKVNDCVFLASFDTPAIIFEQLAVIYALVHNRARNMKVIVPWFPTGTMERVSEPGEIATANTMARLLSAIPLGVTGATVVSFLDIHALQEQFYFGDNVSIELKTGMGLLPLKASDIIAFPDDGAYKRYKRMFLGRQLIVCEKRRIGAQRKVVIKEGPDMINPDTQRVFIVDDMIQTGGTMIQCAKAIREAHPNVKVHMYATHGVFPETTIDTEGSCVADYRRSHPRATKWPSWYRFLNSNDVHRVYVTNSIPKNEMIALRASEIIPDKFVCLDITPVVRSIINDTNESKYES